ncbi:MoaD/ThiS family protein [Terrimonas sp. NA20]|uniref:MoaD/ThiS family protein n=1 Tax=Terrimonas ginsenosidimutans TaxID=2908004 RepID=A0ABS9KP34_9BACT|nr:MoaD/ThiS family protein [Terrimonas ginsenosidimutans]MCG2614092.1 MoaD/ThiS family protein [Terrimonas ginsenosidimutans]
MTDTLTIRCFGQLTDILGSARLEVPITNDSEELMHLLLKEYPLLKTTRFIVSVDRKVIREKTVLTPGSEIALLPPFSGG